MRRIMASMSQTSLADELGITFQQIQKYESGFNRISASRLHKIAGVLGVTVEYFFEGAPGGSRGKRELPDYISKFFATADGLALTKAFTSITSNSVRRRMVHLVESIAAT